ncbi:MAG: hypothetical protein ACREAE_00070 [Nitrosopumilaceae archaeon]
MIIAKVSSAFDSFREKTCVIIKVQTIKIMNASSENNPAAEEIMKNQTEKPSVTANALNRGEGNSILDRIN